MTDNLIQCPENRICGVDYELYFPFLLNKCLAKLNHTQTTKVFRKLNIFQVTRRG